MVRGRGRARGCHSRTSLAWGATEHCRRGAADGNTRHAPCSGRQWRKDQRSPPEEVAMAHDKASGDADERDRTKQEEAREDTKGGSKPEAQENMQAGSGGRGGHRKRKGGEPEG